MAEGGTSAGFAPRLVPAGDAALVVELGATIDPVVNDRVLAFDGLLAAAAIPGVTETVPTYRSVLVLYDPTVLAYEALVRRVQGLLATLPADPHPALGRRWRLPVVYGGAYGVDLGGVAAAHGLTEAAAVALHSGAEYRVYMIGFQPGFSYLGGLDPRLHTSRRTDPRPTTPAGSISIGGMQTAVSSVAAPSGWHLLGRTPVRAFDPDRTPAFLLATGDRVCFDPVPAAAWEPLAARAAAGDPVAERLP